MSNLPTAYDERQRTHILKAESQQGNQHTLPFLLLLASVALEGLVALPMVRLRSAFTGENKFRAILDPGLLISFRSLQFFFHFLLWVVLTRRCALPR